MPTGKASARRRVVQRTDLRAAVPILPVTLVLAMLTLAGVGAQPILTTRRGIPLPSAPGTPLGHGSYHVLALELGSGDAPLATLDGAMQIGGQLKEALQALATREPQALLRIQANAALPFSAVQQAVQLAQDQGLTRVMLEIKQREQKHPGDSLPPGGSSSAPGYPDQGSAGPIPPAPGVAAPNPSAQEGPAEQNSLDAPPAPSAGTPR